MTLPLRGALALTALALTLVAAAPAAGQASDRCNPATPERLTPVSPLTGPPALEVRVLVGLDGVSEEQAAIAMRDAAGAYAPLGIDLTVARYVHVDAESPSTDRALDETREQLGGARPEWAHLVLTFTNDELEPAQGMARCIGGIRFDDEAFAITEYIPPGEGGGIISARPDNAGRIAAHELGHLLGAEHHHAVCGEALRFGDPTAPCTLMFPQAPHVTALRFGSLEAAVVRAYAEDHARALPPVPAEWDPRG